MRKIISDLFQRSRKWSKGKKEEMTKWAEKRRQSNIKDSSGLIFRLFPFT
jgi:hypothetical protein